MLHQPGNGIFILPKKCNNRESKKIEDLIFFIFSKLRLTLFIFDESKNNVFPSQEYLTQIHSKISRNV